MMNKKKTKFILVRHGRTSWNKKHLVQGWSDIPLDAVGERQAEKFADKLGEVSIDHIYSSDLKRAKRTAEIIASKYGLEVGESGLIRERNWGPMEGKPAKSLLKYIDTIRDIPERERFRYRLEDGIESDHEVVVRAEKFLRKLADSHEGKVVLVATHGGILKTLLIYYKHFSYKDDFGLGNLASVHLEMDSDRFEVKEVNGLRTSFYKI